MKSNMKLVKELSTTPGISGFETKIANIIKRELKDVADDITTDTMGNIICTKKGKKSAPTIMLASHMDEIGLMVKFIDEKGFIEKAMPKVKPDTNAAEILDYLRAERS